MTTHRDGGVLRGGIEARRQAGAAIECGLEAKNLHRGSPGLGCGKPQLSEIPDPSQGRSCAGLGERGAVLATVNHGRAAARWPRIKSGAMVDCRCVWRERQAGTEKPKNRPFPPNRKTHSSIAGPCCPSVSHLSGPEQVHHAPILSGVTPSRNALPSVFTRSAHGRTCRPHGRCSGSSSDDLRRQPAILLQGYLNKQPFDRCRIDILLRIQLGALRRRRDDGNVVRHRELA